MKINQTKFGTPQDGNAFEWNITIEDGDTECTAGWCYMNLIKDRIPFLSKAVPERFYRSLVYSPNVPHEVKENTRYRGWYRLIKVSDTMYTFTAKQKST